MEFRRLTPVPTSPYYESRMTKELKTLLEFDQLRADNMSKMKATYLALAIELAGPFEYHSP
jgi:hypothetical protein